MYSSNCGFVGMPEKRTASSGHKESSKVMLPGGAIPSNVKGNPGTGKGATLARLEAR